MKKIGLVFLVLALTVGIMFAAGGKESATSSDGKKVIRVMWWGNQTRAANTQAALKVYEAENPGVTFEVEFADWTGYWDKVATLAASGDLPDIIQMDYAYLAQYAGKNLLAPLDSYLGSTIDTTSIPRSIIDSGAYKGKVYALCAGMNAPGIFYDKTVTDAAGVVIDESAPMVWEDFIEIARTVHAKTGKYANMMNDAFNPVFMARDYNMHLYGTDVDAPRVDSTLQNKVLEPYFNLLAQGAKEGWMVPVPIRAEHFTAGIEGSLLVKGITWVEFSWSNMFPTFANAAKRDMRLAFIPKMKDASAVNVYLKPSQFFSMTATSKNKDEAAKVLNFLTNSEKAQDELKAERGVPISSKMAEYVKPSVNVPTQMTFDFVVKAGKIATPIDNPDPKGVAEVRKIIENLRDRVELGQVPPKDAAAQWVKEANEVLSRTK